MIRRSILDILRDEESDARTDKSYGYPPEFDEKIITALQDALLEKIKTAAIAGRVAEIESIDLDEYEDTPEDRLELIREISDTSDMAEYQIDNIYKELGLER